MTCKKFKPLDGVMVGNAGGLKVLAAGEGLDYLGVVLTSTPEQFVNYNLKPILKKVEDKIRVWGKMPLSMSSRISLIKMVILPQIGFFLAAAPSWISDKWFRAIVRLLNGLIWGRKRVRLKYLHFCPPMKRGGFGLPDFKLYYLSYQFGFLLSHKNATWWHEGCFEGNKKDPIIQLESGGIHVNTINRDWFGNHCNKVWKEIKRICKVRGSLDFTELWGNKNMVEFTKIPSQGYWEKLHYIKVKDFFSDGALKSIDSLISDRGDEWGHRFRYLQLKSAYDKSHDKRFFFVNYNDGIHSILGIQGVKHIVSKIYKILLSQKYDLVSEGYKKQWENDLGPLTTEEWDSALSSVAKASVNLEHNLTQFKIIHRVHYTPVFMERIGIRNHSRCNKCGKEGAGLLHLLWSCPVIEEFWSEVNEELNNRGLYEGGISVLSAVLGDDKDQKEHKVLLNSLVFLARLIILRNWISDIKPTRSEWINVVSRVKSLEIATKKPKLSKKWERW